MVSLNDRSLYENRSLLGLDLLLICYFSYHKSLSAIAVDIIIDHCNSLINMMKSKKYHSSKLNFSSENQTIEIGILCIGFWLYRFGNKIAKFKENELFTSIANRAIYIFLIVLLKLMSSMVGINDCFWIYKRICINSNNYFTVRKIRCGRLSRILV